MDERLGLGAILGPLLASFPFWLVCLLSLGTTLLRETFNFWTPTYFVQFVGLSNSDAASRSALFPLLGGVAVVFAGVLSDKLGLNGRNLVIVGGMAACTVCLVRAGAYAGTHQPVDAVALVALVGFLLLGPYSYLAGAMSLDFGGKRGSATAAGIIDGVGYMGGWLSGDTVARVTVRYGWQNAFLMLAVASLLTAVVALVLACSSAVEKNELGWRFEPDDSIVYSRSGVRSARNRRRNGVFRRAGHGAGTQPPGGMDHSTEWRRKHAGGGGAAARSWTPAAPRRRGCGPAWAGHAA